MNRNETNPWSDSRAARATGFEHLRAQSKIHNLEQAWALPPRAVIARPDHVTAPEPMRRIRLRASLALALALGAFAVPASAMPISDGPSPSAASTFTPADRVASHQIQSFVGRTTYQPAPPAADTSASAVGDDHARNAGTDRPTGPDLVVAVGDDHARTDQASAGSTQDGIQTALEQPAQPATADGEFNWTDAGIGFGAAAGLALLGGGSLVAARRSHRSGRPAL
jgi:hypothetical protein